jgi:hypothetical protein
MDRDDRDSNEFKAGKFVARERGTARNLPCLRLLRIGILLLAMPSALLAKTVVVGGGGGDLDYPNAQSSLALAAGDTIAIKAGLYTSLNFGKLRGTAAKKIVITNTGGQVEVANSCQSCSSNLTDAVHVVFTGAGVTGIDKGFFFHDIPFRGLQLHGDMDSTTISDCKFANVADNVIRMDNSSVKYDGTSATLTSGLKFLRLSFKNCGNAVDWGDYANTTNLMGVGLDIELAYNTVDSFQGGTAFRLNKVYKANIHHNTVTDMGLGLTSTHPGIFLLRGDGDVHHNVVRRVWGECSRHFGSGLNGPGEVRVYNNIFVGSRKYSSVEVQTYAADISTDTSSRPYFAKCDYHVFNNTMGNQSAADFTAAMVDVYTLEGGTCEIRNNLGFNIAKDKPYSATYNYVYNLENPNPPDTSHNIYRSNFVDAGLVDTVECQLLSTSAAVDKGVAVAWITDDFGGIARPQGKALDVGAREFLTTASMEGVSRQKGGASGLRIVGNKEGFLVGVDSPTPDARVRDLSGRILSSRISMPGSRAIDQPAPRP